MKNKKGSKPGVFAVKGDDISERLIAFAVRIIRLVQALPKNTVGKHIGSQMLRSGTSTGSNYEEARGAESRADFVHKLALSWKEIKETYFWLRVTLRAELLKPSRLGEIIQEANELNAILAQSLKTARTGRRE